MSVEVEPKAPAARDPRHPEPRPLPLVFERSGEGKIGTTAGGISVANNAALEIQNSITVGAEALSLSGTGVSNGGALRNVSGTNVYGGAITLTGATRINADAGTLTPNGAIGGAGQNLTLAGSSGATTTLAGIIGTTTGTLTADGAGTGLLRADTGPELWPANAAAGEITADVGSPDHQQHEKQRGKTMGRVLADQHGRKLCSRGVAKSGR